MLRSYLFCCKTISRLSAAVLPSYLPAERAAWDYSEKQAKYISTYRYSHAGENAFLSAPGVRNDPG